MPSTTEKQRRFFGAVMGAKKGKPGSSGKAKEVAKDMSKEQIKHYLKKAYEDGFNAKMAQTNAPSALSQRYADQAALTGPTYKVNKSLPKWLGGPAAEIQAPPGTVKKNEANDMNKQAIVGLGSLIRGIKETGMTGRDIEMSRNEQLAKWLDKRGPGRLMSGLWDPMQSGRMYAQRDLLGPLMSGQGMRTAHWDPMTGFRGGASSIKALKQDFQPGSTEAWHVKPAYAKGFEDKCAAMGVDPAALIKLAKEKEEKKDKEDSDKPDYEARRRKVNMVVPGVLGGLQGSIIGASANRQSPGMGALAGGVIGGGLGVGAGAIVNAIRKYLGMSAMGAPVTVDPARQ